MVGQLIRETRKFPNVLLIDFGTMYAKVSLMIGGKLIDDLLLIKNELYFISEEKVKYLENSSDGEIKIKPGYYTYKEITDNSLLFQADEKFVQSNSIPQSVDLLCKAYRNICEHIEKELDLPFPILGDMNTSQWAIVGAVAAFETKEARDTVEKLHTEACAKFGFQAGYFNNQLLFDYFSQLSYVSTTGMEGYCVIINIGGGDTEVAVVSGLPHPSSYRRFNLGTQDIFHYCELSLREQYRVTGVIHDEVEKWLRELGNVNSEVSSTSRTWRRKEIDVSPYANAPELLFDWFKYFGVERRFNSVSEIVFESIEALISETDVDLGPVLSTVIVVGGAAQYKGLTARIEKDLKEYFQEYKDIIRVTVGEDPQNSGINGIRALVNQKYSANSEGLLFTIFDSEEGIDWQFSE